MMPGEAWAVVTGVAFLLGSIALFLVLHIRQRNRREAIVNTPVASQQVRDASHELANESTKLRAGLRRLSVAPNPIRSLVSAIEDAAKNPNGKSNNGHA